MMIKLLLAGFVAFTPIATSAIAGDERADHYDVETPKSWSDAENILTEKTAAMKKAYETGDLHSMHELSYHLEAATEKLEQDIEKLEELIDLVHHASEDEEKDKLAKYFPKMESQITIITTK